MVSICSRNTDRDGVVAIKKQLAGRDIMYMHVALGADHVTFMS